MTNRPQVKHFHRLAQTLSFPTLILYLLEPQYYHLEAEFIVLETEDGRLVVRRKT